MDGKVVAELLLLFASEATLEGAELSWENIEQWAQQLDECGGEEKTAFEALALDQSAMSTPEKRREFTGEVSVSLETIHFLVHDIRNEVSSKMTTIALRAKQYTVEKKRRVVEKNREKKAIPDWHQKAIRLAEQGLPSAVIAARVRHSVSQVRRVLNKQKKARMLS